MKGLQKVLVLCSIGVIITYVFVYAPEFNQMSLQSALLRIESRLGLRNAAPIAYGTQHWYDIMAYHAGMLLQAVPKRLSALAGILFR